MSERNDVALQCELAYLAVSVTGHAPVGLNGVLVGDVVTVQASRR